MRIALINSGLGLLGAAAALRRLRPDADLVLAMDPDGMPWGPRHPDDIAARSLACARAAAAFAPDVLVFACNTGSVHALGALREEFEPALPVVGTVPAIKPAAAAGRPVAIWATAATTGSVYQHGLIAQFAAHVPVTEVACHGLADAIHAGDDTAIERAVSAAAALTPPGIHAVVLGCTEYELAAGRIAAAVPGATPFGSATAVAAQALRRAAPGDPRATATTGDPSRPAASGGPASTATTRDPGHTTASESSGSTATSGGSASTATTRDPGHTTVSGSSGSTATSGGSGGTATTWDPSLAAASGGPGSTASAGTGSLTVLLSGRQDRLPEAALLYPEGRLLAGLPAHQAGSALA